MNRQPICTETNPSGSSTPGPTGWNDSADPTHSSYRPRFDIPAREDALEKKGKKLLLNVTNEDWYERGGTTTEVHEWWNGHSDEEKRTIQIKETSNSLIM